ncbi:MAG: peptidase [Candidatus Cloacimonadota bacterium]|nr:MAG: peptidase [Candidatus Cloacimonadota bacterium]PIE78087.1 MAG: peptidase [Candidatus Delongbacteria bacterium]
MKFLILMLLPAVIFCSEITKINIEGMIDNGLVPYVERAIGEAETSGSKYIIVEINTFGGRVDAATKLKDLIIDTDISTIAFINKRAISAGSLIALSCDSIFMAEGSSIGATTVVDGEGKKQSEKAQSYMRGEMGSTAERTGKNKLIAQAMVDEDIEIENIVEKGKLLTLTSEEALNYKIADKIVKNESEIYSILGLSKNDSFTVKISKSEKIVRFLTHPIVSSLLITLAFLGLVFEVKTPGWGVGGTVGILSLLLFFGSHYIVDLANHLELIILLVSFVLIVLEIFVIPGFGIAGILGLLGLLTSLFFVMVGENAYLEDYVEAGNILSSALLISIAGGYFMIKYIPSMKLFSSFVVLKENPHGSAISNQDEYLSLLNLEGVTTTDLRPSGKVSIKKRYYDAISEGNFIDSNTKIRVIKVEGNKIVVEKLA